MPAKKYTKPEAVLHPGERSEILDGFNSSKSCVDVEMGCGGMSSNGRLLRSAGFKQCNAVILKDVFSGNSALFHVEPSYYTIREEHQEILVQFMYDYLDSLPIEPAEKEVLRSFIKKVTSPDQKKPTKISAFERRMKKLNKSGRVKARFVIGREGIEDNFSIDRAGKAHRIEPWGWFLCFLNLRRRHPSFNDLIPISIRSVLIRLGVRIDEDILVDMERWAVLYAPKKSKIYVRDAETGKALRFSF